MKATFIFCILAILTFAVSAGEVADVPVYLAEVRVFTVTDVDSIGPFQAQDVQIEVQALRASNEVQIFRASKLDMKWGDVNLHMEGETLEWDGKPDPPELSQIKLYTKPKLQVMAGQKGALRIGQEVPVAYFEPVATNTPPSTEPGLNDEPSREFTFVQKLDRIELGLGLDLVIEPDAEDEWVKVQLRYWFADDFEREQLDGVLLDVGKPIVKKDETSSDFRTKLNNWTYLIRSNPGQDILFMFIKVHEVEPGD